jgi:hypothetical protein
LRHSASIEDVDYHATRGLDRAMFIKLAATTLDQLQLKLASS